MATIKRFLLDELKTFSPSFVDQQIRSYADLPETAQQRAYLGLMYLRSHSENIEHAFQVIQQLSPELQMQNNDQIRRNYILYLLAVAYFRTGNIEMCVSLLNQRNHAVPAHVHTLSFVRWLDRHLHTPTSKYVAKVIGKGLVITVSLFYLAKLGGVLVPPMAKGLKIAAKNMQVVSEGGKFGVALKFPVT